jgi:eukaryotic-like serine/threonine-protein kinase
MGCRGWGCSRTGFAAGGAGSIGVVKILEFGLAKLRLDIDTGRTKHRHTLTGVILGTAAYTAPEHIRGEAVDTRADLFAVGVMLYEMLTGRHPFRCAKHLGNGECGTDH